MTRNEVELTSEEKLLKNKVEIIKLKKKKIETKNKLNKIKINSPSPFVWKSNADNRPPAAALADDEANGPVVDDNVGDPGHKFVCDCVVPIVELPQWPFAVTFAVAAAFNAAKWCKFENGTNGNGCNGNGGGGGNDDNGDVWCVWDTDGVKKRLPSVVPNIPKPEKSLVVTHTSHIFNTNIVFWFGALFLFCLRTYTQHQVEHKGEFILK